MVSTTEGVTTMRSQGQPPEGSPRGVEVGAEIGRYIVLGELGRGGMGVVLRAYDPELEREVALKTLRTGAEQGPYRAAVLAEARALAKLRHANVVGVYDVGEHDDLIWIAMELVRGASLRAWLAEADRTPAEVRRVLRDAGAGLMAAHEAKIVHCDVKPENIVVADRGYVVDFGLAHGIGTREASEGRPDGTRPYLAPELFEGEPPSVASDVYAFCVTAWEVLTGSRPEASELTDSSRRVPRRLASVLREGLGPQPSKRPRSMAPILAALEESPRALRRVAALGGLAALAAAWAMNREPDCAPPLDVAPFEEGSTAAVRQALRAHSPEDAELRWAVVSANVDAFRDEYARQYRAACERALIRRESSKQTFEAQKSCLSRRRRQLVVLVDELAEAGPEALREAPRSIARLSSTLRCDDAGSGTGRVAEAFEAELDRVEVLELLSRFEEAQALAASVEADARQVGDRPAELWAQYRRGRLLQLQDDASEAAELLSQVHWQAEAADVPTLASTAGLYVMWIHAAVFDDTDAALSWAPHVEAAVRRAGDDTVQHAKLIENRGIAKLYGSRIPEAYEDFVTALELRESAPGDVEIEVVSSLGNLGIALEEMGRYDEAIEAQSRALEILERRLGPTHPHTARVVDNLGTARLRNGEVDAALELFERALQARRVAFGDQHRSTALSWTHIGLAQLQAEQTEAALRAFQTALPILEGLDEPGQLLARCLEALAHTHAARGEWADATTYARDALGRLPESMPPDHPEREALREILEAARDAQ